MKQSLRLSKRILNRSNDFPDFGESILLQFLAPGQTKFDFEPNSQIRKNTADFIPRIPVSFGVFGVFPPLVIGRTGKVVL